MLAACCVTAVVDVDNPSHSSVPETLMDSRWATTELAWTTFPESGVGVCVCVCLCVCVCVCVRASMLICCVCLRLCDMSVGCFGFDLISCFLPFLFVCVCTCVCVCVCVCSLIIMHAMCFRNIRECVCVCVVWSCVTVCVLCAG